MQLVETSKIFIPHQATLGVPPTIDGLRCLGTKTLNEWDVFEYCKTNTLSELKNINGIYFRIN